MGRSEKIKELYEKNAALAQLLQIESIGNQAKPVFFYNPQNKIENTEKHVRYMMARTSRMFEYDGLPDSMPRRELEMLLQSYGHCIIAKVNGELYALSGQFVNLNKSAYKAPTKGIKYLVVNPALDLNKEFTIGVDCVLILNDSSYLGLGPLLTKYGFQLSENELTINVVDILSRSALVFAAKSELEYETANAYIEKLEDGELGVVRYENRRLPGEEVNPVEIQPGATQSAAIITNLIELEQYLKASEMNELGLNANWNAKRESLSSSESLLNEDTLLPFVDDMKLCRQEGFEEVNKMFSTNITVDFGSAWKQNEIEQEEALEAISEGDDINEQSTEASSEESENEREEREKETN